MKIITSFLVLLLAATGCVTKVETIEASHAEEQPQPKTQPKTAAADKRILMGRGLDQMIHIVGIRSSIGPGGYLKIQVNVQNQTSSIQKFSYRIDWFDQDGKGLPMASSEPLTWMLLSHETSFLAATSPTPAARDFRVVFASN